MLFILDSNVEASANIEKSEPVKQRKKKKKINSANAEDTEDKSKKDDFDAILAEFSKTNYVCSFESCKISTKLVHLSCEFCKQWFCLQHGNFIKIYIYQLCKYHKKINKNQSSFNFWICLNLIL